MLDRHRYLIGIRFKPGIRGMITWLFQVMNRVARGQEYQRQPSGRWGWMPMPSSYPAPWDRFLEARPTIIHLLYSPAWESPPIRKGCPAQKFWRYQDRMDRIDRLRQRYEASKGRKLLIVESLWFGDLTLTTMKHCEALGYSYTEDEFGMPIWQRPDGSMVP